MPLSDAEISGRLAGVREETVLHLRHFRLAALLSELFRELGADPVVVGGSAVEFYTNGQYVSGDVDFCFAGALVPTLAQRAAVMDRLDAEVLGVHKFVVAGVFVDVLGAIENLARTPYQEIGAVKLVPIEELAAERVFMATSFPSLNPEREAVARTLLAVVLSDAVEADRAEIRRLADSPAYGVGAELERLTGEVLARMASVAEATPGMDSPGRPPHPPQP